MKFNEKLNRWFTKEGLVYRYDEKKDKLILCKQHKDYKGYMRAAVNRGDHIESFKVHRAVYETFVGEIPEGYTIDHINTIKDDNRLENLRCVTMAENNRNEITVAKRRAKGPRSEFGRKFKEHYGLQYWEDKKLFARERSFVQRYGHCSWEVENGRN